MSQSLKFGFLAGLLAGTAAVGTVGLMMGQTEAHAQPRAIQKPLILELTQSPDGKTAYLWGIDPKTQTLTFLQPARAEGESLGSGLHESGQPGNRHLGPGDPEHGRHGQGHTPGDHGGEQIARESFFLESPMICQSIHKPCTQPQRMLARSQPERLNTGKNADEVARDLDSLEDKSGLGSPHQISTEPKAMIPHRARLEIATAPRPTGRPLKKDFCRP